MGNKSYHQLVVWKEAHSFVLEVYSRTASFPPEERYGLTSQIRRAAVSIPANIVEGIVKTSIRDQLRFCEIALGSLNECSYLLELADDLRYLTKEQHERLNDQRARTEYLLIRFMTVKGWRTPARFPPS